MKHYSLARRDNPVRETRGIGFSVSIAYLNEKYLSKSKVF